MERTELSAFGEFGLIKHLTKGISTKVDSTIKGIGDDAAVIDNGGELAVVTTDMLVEGIHFDMTYTPLKHLGYKAVVVNLSDVYAMNAIPKQITFSLAISNRFSVEALEELYSGVKMACEVYGVDLVGGDTTSSITGLLLSVTAIGSVKKGNEVYRSGAKEYDLVCVSGDLGAAYVGLQLLEREKKIFKENTEIKPDLEGYDYVLERILKPEARKEVVEKLKELEIVPTSMIDISDGLASELHHICTSSEVGCSIFSDKLPIDPATVSGAESFNMDPVICAMNGGEDYELLFTIKQDDYDKLKGETEISVIGHITDKESGLRLAYPSGSVVSITAQGWDSFPEKD